MKNLTPSQQQFIDELNLSYEAYGFVHTFKHRQNELIFCLEDQKYTLIYGDYMIDRGFELPFETDDAQLRFGLVYEGTSEFKFKNHAVTHFFPSSFIAIEDHLTGVQQLKKGHHYRGIELFVHMNYIETLKEAFPELDTIKSLPTNHAILFLPTQVGHIMNCLECMLRQHELSPLMLHAKVLEALSYIATELSNMDDKPLLHLMNSGVFLSKSSGMNLADVQAIQKAQSLLKQHLDNPPSIAQLAKDLLIGEQKLMQGFKDMYHMTIGSYIQEMRLQEAANLLSTTEFPIDEISKKVGYNHASNFGKAFKKKFFRSPLQYRKFNQRK